MAKKKQQEKSKKFDKVAELYNNGNGVWAVSRVRDAVVKEWITEAEFQEITGVAY